MGFHLFCKAYFYGGEMPCVKNKVPILALTGLLTASFGIVMFFIFPLIMQAEIKKKLVLKEGTEGYKNWNDIPVPIYLSIYFFNVTNTDEIYNYKKKPVLQELGPYTFR
nr:scavenger receptor class B member 1-like isoform X2 [Parasteatoda tepidariorum]